MMRGPTYDDGYITRKLASLQTSPTFLPPAPSRRPHYLQSVWKYRPRPRTYNYRISVFPGYGKLDTRYFPIPRCRSLSPLRGRSLSPLRSSRSPSPEPRSSPGRDYSTPARGYIPSANTQLILNRISVNPRDYPPLHVPRVAPRMPPPYYDYDYGYGAYGGYGGFYGDAGYGYYPPARPRVSRYDAYLDDDIDMPPSVSYQRYNRATRLADQIVEAEKEKLLENLRQSPVRTTKTTTSYTLPQFSHTRNVSPRMLQDEVDNIRTRLKGLSYSLDPSGPVPEIITPDRGRRATSVENARRYTSGPKHLACVEFAGGVPQWKRKARSSFRYPSEVPEVETSAYEAARSTATDPEKLLLKDNLSMKIHTFLGDTMDGDRYKMYLKTYRDPAMPPPTSQWRQEYYKPRLYKAGVDGLGSTYSSKFPTKSKAGTAETKWEEPDTIYSAKDKQPYSKEEEQEEKAEE